MDESPAGNNTAGEGSKSNKQRFKGIETFLRRVAFNLGNTPSQTEVKIISCVPIDVTDLQNKIITLERQLQEATNSTKKTPVLTTLIEPTTRNAIPVQSWQWNDNRILGMENATTITSGYDGSSKQRKSTASLVIPSWPANGISQNKPNSNTIDNQLEKGGHRRNFFRRAKKSKPITTKTKPKTQLVYYAHTENSPFNNHRLSTDNTIDNYSTPSRTIDNAFSKSYLANVIHRHFDPERVVEEFSDTSNFTSPVCRDFRNNVHRLYESDVCSCCHGQFQNVDKYIGRNESFIIDPIPTHLYNQLNRNRYYDSNLYDVVPVKEKANKIAKEEKQKEHKCYVDMQCWPEKAKFKSRYLSTDVNHPTKLPIKSKKIRTTVTRLPHQKYDGKEYKEGQGTGPTDTSKSCCVDCSDIYTKPVIFAHKTEKPDIIRPIFRQNAECLTIDVDTNKLTITRSIQIDINSTENKTEETLNQIKSILLSVLAEVKTNPQVNNNTPEVKTKKDAVIQKGPSQPNMQTCSSLLHSFTYNNSYSANPYIGTCSRQIPPHLCYTNVPCQPLRYTQNFPLLIQTPGQKMNECIYKNTSHNTRPIHKVVATAATNTGTYDHEIQGNETEKLIKEIYKSIALTMDLPKESSNSTLDDVKSAKSDSLSKSDPKAARSTVTVMSYLRKKDMQVEASITPFSVTTVKSTCNTGSVGTISETKLEVEPRLQYESQSTDTDVVAMEPTRNRAKVVSTISEHSEVISTDAESESDGVVERIGDSKVHTEKQGLLKRMLGSVRLFNRKREDYRHVRADHIVKNEIDDKKSESDSDDYQTIYSENSNRLRDPNRRHCKSRRYASGRPVQTRTTNKRRSPYMDQEYRKQWDEKLVFQENRGKRYSSERPFTIRQSPVYWQNYETRSAMVDHGTPYSKQLYGRPFCGASRKVERQTSPMNGGQKNYKLYENVKSKVSWLKKHKPGVSCGEQWKKFILEN